jgi:hypothetical protein
VADVLFKIFLDGFQQKSIKGIFLWASGRSNFIEDMYAPYLKGDSIFGKLTENIVESFK